MIGGQSVDVKSTGHEIPPEKLRFIYQLKTAALDEAAMMIGVLLAGGDDAAVSAAEKAARAVGMAFQIRDDILDVISTSEELGKTVGSDEKNQKVTMVTLFGVNEADALVRQYSDEALMQLAQIPGDTAFLKELFLALINRRK